MKSPPMRQRMTWRSTRARPRTSLPISNTMQVIRVVSLAGPPAATTRWLLALGDALISSLVHLGLECRPTDLVWMSARVRFPYPRHSSDITVKAASITVSTFYLDVMEGDDHHQKNQFWMTAKYGGFNTSDPAFGSNGFPLPRMARRLPTRRVMRARHRGIAAVLMIAATTHRNSTIRPASQQRWQPGSTVLSRRSYRLFLQVSPWVSTAAA